ncbi:MAG: hypothetical protein VKO39_02200 [Cyanobacteriota bacterium]|nr:hypothetical protein [Cyanobacteriota bacterium]
MAMIAREGNDGEQVSDVFDRVSDVQRINSGPATIPPAGHTFFLRSDTLSIRLAAHSGSLSFPQPRTSDDNTLPNHRAAR